MIAKTETSAVPFQWAPVRQDPAAEAPLEKEPDPRYDGCFIGEGGALYTSETNWRDIPVIRPNNGVAATRSVIMLNGILCDVALQMADLQAMANTGCNVIGIHNATKGMMRDLAQCLGDKLNLSLSNNGATRTATKVLSELVSEENPPELIGHSQGAICLSNAVQNVLDSGTQPEELSKIDVTTLAGAGMTFPKGPRYQHWVNTFDVVPGMAGVLPVAWAKEGPDYRTHYFNELKKPTHLPPLKFGIINYVARAIDQSSHGATDLYIPAFARTRDNERPNSATER